MLLDPKAEERLRVRMVLLNAAALIRRDGWCQNLFYSLGARCALAAIFDAAGEDIAAVHGAERIVGAHVKAPWLPHWNDAPGRTKEEVVAALEGAAATV